MRHMAFVGVQRQIVCVQCTVHCECVLRYVDVLLVWLMRQQQSFKQPNAECTIGGFRLSCIKHCQCHIQHFPLVKKPSFENRYYKNW